MECKPETRAGADTKKKLEKTKIAKQAQGHRNAAEADPDGGARPHLAKKKV